MSSSKLDRSGVFQPYVVKSEARCLNLPSESVRFHKNGLEFLSSAALPPWTEVTVDLQAPDNSRIQGAAIVVACDGNARTGYVVSLMFTGLSPQAESRLGQLANL